MRSMSTQTVLLRTTLTRIIYSIRICEISDYTHKYIFLMKLLSAGGCHLTSYVTNTKRFAPVLR